MPTNSGLKFQRREIESSSYSMRGHDWINTVLPEELIVEIFRCLDSKLSRDACSLVCRRWLKLERLSRTTLRIGATGSPDLFVQLLARRFVNVKNVHIDERLAISLPLHSGRRRRNEVMRLPFKSHHATHNTGTEGAAESSCLSDAGLIALSVGFPNLEKLSLIWCSNISSQGLTSLAEKCKFLKSLDLQGCYVGDRGVAAVGVFCKLLKDVNFRFCEGLTDVGLVELSRGCGKSLKSFGMAACAKITDVALEAVGMHCKYLESISLDSEVIHDKGVLSLAQGCTLLKVLKLQCTNVTDEALVAVGSLCPFLELLALYSFQEFTDNFCIRTSIQGNPNAHFFGVFDGHGQFGMQCSNFVKDKLIEKLCNDPKLLDNPVQAYNSAFLCTNDELHTSEIDDSMSGTTAITVLVVGDTLYVANVGDSRAVIAVKEGNRVLAKDLSNDQTPFRKDEYERVRLCGARVLSVDQVEGLMDPDIQCWGDEESQGGDPPRLWVQNGLYPGTAFTRSIGDSTAEKIGVIAVPEVLVLQLKANHLFFVVASDGVFEFLSSQTVVDMASSYADPQDACTAIAAESYKLWMEHENRTDDITIIIVHIKGLSNV
ncbi:putative protein phosphatase 2C 35, partial [Cucurbita argyrosperma subsp. sororia]